MTILRSYWVMCYGCDGIWTVSAILEQSMLNALSRYLTKPLKFYTLTEHSDMHWQAEDGERGIINVRCQIERPDRAIEICKRKIETDQRDPELLESIKRDAGGFKRVPGKINF